MTDKYKTVHKDTIGEGFYSEKRSKFLAFVHHIESAEEALDVVRHYKKKYYDARHCCYAYRLGADGAEFRANDDGEPSSTAGKPILGQLISNDITNTLICGIAHSKIEEKFVEHIVHYTFSYPMMNDVMKIVKDMNANIVEQKFDNTCEIVLSIRKSFAEQLEMRLNSLSFA